MKSITKRRRLAISMVALSLGALSACGSGSADSATEASSAKLGQVNFVGFEGSPLNTIERLAVKKGFFEDHDLEVKFVGASSAATMASALLGDSAQFGTVSLPVTAPLAQQGTCFQYDTAQFRNYTNIIAGPDVELEHQDEPYPANLKDLEGKKIGIVAVGTSQEAQMNRLLADAGLEPGDVTYVATGGAATAVSAFREGQVDIQFTFPPVQQLLKPDEYQMVADLLDTDGDALDPLIQAFSGTTCDYAKSNPEQVEAFCAGIWDAYDFVNDPANKDEMGSFMAEILDTDKALGDQIWNDFSTSLPSAGFDEESWDAQSAFLPDSSVKIPAYGDVVNPGCAVDDPRK